MIRLFIQFQFLVLIFSLHGSWSKKNELEFIHIAKNAGTTIEYAAAKEGIAWGACHYHKFGICLDVEPDLTWNGGSRWHFLPHEFNLPNRKTFVVVRNPYDRVISYYHYYHRNKKANFLNKKKNLNEFVVQTLKGIKLGSLIPSYDYVFDKNGVKVIDYVLHFETLDSDGKFGALMRRYNLNVKLPEKSMKPHNSGARLTVNDLSKDAIAFINESYENDFTSFGYDFL